VTKYIHAHVFSIRWFRLFLCVVPDWAGMRGTPFWLLCFCFDIMGQCLSLVWLERCGTTGSPTYLPKIQLGKEEWKASKGTYSGVACGCVGYLESKKRLDLQFNCAGNWGYLSWNQDALMEVVMREEEGCLLLFLWMNNLPNGLYS
jgi:hypothetical protein